MHQQKKFKTNKYEEYYQHHNITLPDGDIEDIKWRINEGQSIQIGDVIASYKLRGSPKYEDLLSPVDGKVLSLQKTLTQNRICATLFGCKHEEEFHQMCAVCGAELSNRKYHKTTQRSMIANVHGKPTLKVLSENAVRMHKDQTKKLLEMKKLSLVLDLDHTLLHATIDPRAAQLLSINPQIKTFNLKNRQHYVKLRPHLEQFLKDCCKLFELHIFTHGERPYAEKIANILDPNGTLFQERIISRDEFPSINSKTLKQIFPSSDDQTVLILDDRADVWQEHLSNLITITPYTFFHGLADVNNAPGIQTHKAKEKNGSFVSEEKDEKLKSVWLILKQVHDEFFSTKTETVANILGKIKKKVLFGLHFVFSGVIPTSSLPEESLVWKLAEEFGATCHKTFCTEITHVIAAKRGTEKVKLAEKTPGCYVVHISWLYDCINEFTRLNEFDYLLYSKNVTLPLNVHYNHCNESMKKLHDEGRRLVDQLHREFMELRKQQSVIQQEILRTQSFIKQMNEQSTENTSEIDEESDDDLARALEEELETLS